MAHFVIYIDDYIDWKRLRFLYLTLSLQYGQHNSWCYGLNSMQSSNDNVYIYLHNITSGLLYSAAFAPLHVLLYRNRFCCKDENACQIDKWLLFLNIRLHIRCIEIDYGIVSVFFAQLLPFYVDVLFSSHFIRYCYKIY